MRKKDPEQALLEAALKDAVPADAPKPKKSRRAKSSPAPDPPAVPHDNAHTCTPSTRPSKSGVVDFAPTPPERKRQIVIVCFGTMSIAGDSLGPMVGTLLCARYNIPAFVYGTEERSVNGKNMREWLAFIRTAHKDALFIAVDAGLGTRDKVGKIVIRSDGVCPAAIKGKTERFGDVGILGVVAENKGDSLMQLMAVSPLYVEKLANKVAFLLQQAI